MFGVRVKFLLTRIGLKRPNVTGVKEQCEVCSSGEFGYKWEHE